ncbi:MAG TPA: ABC transporter permease [Aggregatilineales bacterium]|nr:ABC transporter permease [Aggregatilineales bacterium]HPV05996.1 ABC transporter permease [Aggregatilineales bacterium]HQA68077.1 ABC transporter permease [Aggregatilineales bacterium]
MLAKRPQWGIILDTFTPVLAVLAALLIGALMLMALDVNPIRAYSALVTGAFGSTNAIADTIVKATPLLFVGLGICIAFRGGVINIGGEGQMIIGALGTTAFALALPDAPPGIIIPASLLLGFVLGGLYGGIAGFLKAYFGVNEILTTVMLNSIAVQLMNFLLRGPMIDPDQFGRASRIPQTARLSAAFDLPRLVPTRLHAGAFIAVALAILVYIFLWRTTIGYRIRAVGLNREASRYAGINTKRYMVLSLALSGAFAGLAGAVQVLGLYHRMVTDGSPGGFTGSAGFNGIVAALFGQLHPLGTIPAAFFFGALLVGANSMQRAVQIPAALITALNGLVVVFVVSSELWRRRRARRREMQAAAEITHAAQPVTPTPLEAVNDR